MEEVNVHLTSQSLSGPISVHPVALLAEGSSSCAGRLQHKRSQYGVQCLLYKQGGPSDCVDSLLNHSAVSRRARPGSATPARGAHLTAAGEPSPPQPTLGATQAAAAMTLSATLACS